jgi:hypothetical protein
MSNGSSPQVRGGYYLQPLSDDGPFEKHLAAAGAIVGQVAAAVYLPEGGAATQGMAGIVGEATGKSLGFYIDNASAILQNLQTLQNELDDYRTWMDPLSSAMSN